MSDIAFRFENVSHIALDIALAVATGLTALSTAGFWLSTRSMLGKMKNFHARDKEMFRRRGEVLELENNSIRLSFKKNLERGSTQASEIGETEGFASARELDILLVDLYREIELCVMKIAESRGIQTEKNNFHKILNQLNRDHVLSVEDRLEIEFLVQLSNSIVHGISVAEDVKRAGEIGAIQMLARLENVSTPKNG